MLAELELERIGFYAMVGEAPTTWLTQTGPSGSTILPGSGIGNKSFSREGFVGQFYFGPHVDLTVVTQHGEDNAWFGQGYGDFIDGVATANNTTGTTLPAGAQTPLGMGCCSNRITSTARNSSSSAGMKRSECRNKRMALDLQLRLRPTSAISPPTPSAIAINPFMTSRAGFAWHNEYNWLHQDGTGPTLGLTSANINTSELLVGFDFDF